LAEADFVDFWTGERIRRVPAAEVFQTVRALAAEHGVTWVEDPADLAGVAADLGDPVPDELRGYDEPTIHPWPPVGMPPPTSRCSAPSRSQSPRRGLKPLVAAAAVNAAIGTAIVATGGATADAAISFATASALVGAAVGVRSADRTDD
jgi:hypothetical protein